MIRNGTPLESHPIGDRVVLVKREDLCAPLPGPSFSKMRGVIAHIKSRPEGVIGVLDTYHSKAGQAVAYACKHLGRKCVNFYPFFKADSEVLNSGKGVYAIREREPWALFARVQQARAYELGAIMESLPAGRSAILYHQAKKALKEYSARHEHVATYMMPNALKLPESVTETSDEVVRTGGVLPREATYVISMSSGTVAAGLIHGLQRVTHLGPHRVILHAGYSRSEKAVRSYIDTCLAGQTGTEVRIDYVDEGFNYRDRVDNSSIPFPCNEFYDAKAWRWLTNHVHEILGPVVFWNIGD